MYLPSIPYSLIQTNCLGLKRGRIKKVKPLEFITHILVKFLKSVKILWGCVKEKRRGRLGVFLNLSSV